MELENLIRRILMSDKHGVVELDEIESELAFSVKQEKPAINSIQREFDLPLRQAREKFERAYLEFHLKQAEGSVGKVAKQAGMERTHLYRKLRALGIDSKQTQTSKE
jgi:DNA-binding NtrC family response regulator